MDLKIKTSLQRTHKKVSKPPERYSASALDKLMYFSLPYSDGQCRCVLKFKDHLDSSKLYRAVELSLKVAPVVGCRFVYHPLQCFWGKGSHSNFGVPFRILETQDTEKETVRFLTEPIDKGEGMQVSVALIRSEYDTLVIKLTHVVADAKGLLDYIRLLSHLYTRLHYNPDYLPLPPQECKRGLGQILKQVGIAAMTKGFFNWNYPKSEWGFPQANSDFSSGAFPVRRIGQERLSFIKTFCHETGIKFTDVITAAFYQALFDILKPRHHSMLPIQLTMDLRQYLPSMRVGTICNLIGAYYPKIRYTNGKSFYQTLQDVQKAVAIEKKRKSWFGGVLFLELLNIVPGFVQRLIARKIVKHEFNTRTSRPNLSNLGVIDPKMVYFGDFKPVDVGLFGPVCYPPNFMTTMYTFNGQLYINSSFCPTAADPQLVDRFLDSLLRYLPA